MLKSPPTSSWSTSMFCPPPTPWRFPRRTSAIPRSSPRAATSWRASTSCRRSSRRRPNSSSSSRLLRLEQARLERSDCPLERLLDRGADVVDVGEGVLEPPRERKPATAPVDNEAHARGHNRDRNHGRHAGPRVNFFDRGTVDLALQPLSQSVHLLSSVQTGFFKRSGHTGRTRWKGI